MTSEVTITDNLVHSIESKNEASSTSEAARSDVLSRFIEEQRNDYYAWQLILFFSEHPFVRFNRLAVVHALNQDNGRRYIQKALDELIDQGIIKASTEGNLPLYSLAENMRRLVLKLTKPAKNE